MLTEEMLKSIETAVKDAAKGLATNSEVVKHIDECIEKHTEAQKNELVQAAEKIKEVEATAAALDKQVKALVKAGSSLRDHYKYLPTKSWPSQESAKDFGLYVLASVCGREKARKTLEEKGFELFLDRDEKDQKALGEGSASGGAILAPEEFIPNLIIQIEKYGVYRRNAMPWPMGSESGTAPKLSSGLTVYCPGPGNSPTASDPVFKAVGLTAKKWLTLTALDSELDEDAAIAIGDVITMLIAMAFARQEDLNGFLGDGTSTYFGDMGITGALRGVDATIANIKSLIVGAGNAYSELTLANHEDVVAILPGYADDGNAKWYANRYYYWSIMVKLAMAAGGANATEILSGSVVRDKTFLGYPVEFTQALPKVAANSQICALFANLIMGAYLGDRARTSIARSTEAYFTTDQIGIRGRERVSIGIHGQGDTTNAGPIAGLITAAS